MGKRKGEKLDFQVSKVKEPKIIYPIKIAKVLERFRSDLTRLIHSPSKEHQHIFLP